MQLNLEERELLERAKGKGYVNMDRSDDYDAVAEAYQQWCQQEKLPYVEVALDVKTSRVTFSLIEADDLFDEQTDALLRQQLPTYCLYDGELLIEDDCLIAGRVLNDRVHALLAWLSEITPSFPAFI